MQCLNKLSEGVDAAIVKRIILKGKLKLISPLIIGGGRSLYGDSDIIVLKDENGQPFIPSSSITGALKHAFEDYEYQGSGTDYEQNKLWFWGGQYSLKEKEECIKTSCQSSLIIADMKVNKDKKALISLRDGIRIDRKTGVVESGKKFDFELVEPGIAFEFKMEVIIRQAFSEELFCSFFNWIAVILSGGEFAIGARTGQGFGLCQLENINVFEFDYQNKEHIIAWLLGDYTGMQLLNPDFTSTAFLPKQKNLVINAEFKIKNSLIVGAYPGNPQAPDKVHIKSQNHDGSGEIAVLPGTSLRGAIRSRSEKIINTLQANGNELLSELFGWVDDQPDSNGDKRVIKSRVKIRESQINKDTYAEEIQYRIQIDRFTGGVINNALFDSMPLWSKDGIESIVTLELSIKAYKNWEAGLMLLVLKDLWNGDLAIGGEKNVGRGVLQGLSATITCDDQIIEMKQVGEELLVYRQGYNPSWDKEAAKILEEKVEALLKHIEEKGSGVKLNA